MRWWSSSQQVVFPLLVLLLSVGPCLCQDGSGSAGLGAGGAGCPVDQVSFEVVTGYVYTAPNDMLDSQPGTLMLTDCIDTCRNNASCRSINYETGLCVLFSSSADDNQGILVSDIGTL